MMTDNPYLPQISEPVKTTLPPRPKAVWKILAVLAIGFVIVGLIVPTSRRSGESREAVRRMQCANNLKQIAIALLEYERVNRRLPPAYTVDPDGRPLHSWRTLILPYLDQREVYGAVDLTKPWDDPVNAAVRDADIPAYRCFSTNLEPGFTNYLTVLSERSCLQPAQGRRLTDIKNPSETLLVIEADAVNAVHWMSPVDLELHAMMQVDPKAKAPHGLGRSMCYVDGSVGFLLNNNLAQDLPSIVDISR